MAVLTLASDLAKDAGSRYFAGPVNSSGEGRAPRADNDDGTFADTRITIGHSGIRAYTVCFTDLVVGGAGNFIQVIGSATTVVRILAVVVTKPSTAISISVRKQSTADSGGTSTTPTPVPHDANNAAATAIVKGYTAAPTQGTLVGLLAPAQTVNTSDVFTVTEERMGQAWTLRGTSQGIALVASAAATVDVQVTFTEDTA